MMMLLEAFSPFPACTGLVYFNGRTRRKRSCPLRRVLSQLGFLGSLLSVPVLPLDCRPSPEICLIHQFGLKDVPKRLGVSRPYCVGGQQPLQAVAIPGSPCSPPSTPGPCACPAQELLPRQQTPRPRGCTAAARFCRHGGVG